MPMHRSVSTISSPEFINLTPLDISPLMSACEVKILYINANRNGSVITKEVAIEMAKKLRGAPIVGCFKEEKQDFIDHGEQIYIDEDGVHFKKTTRPYGFISPDSKVWFKDFEEYDEKSKQMVIRTYLMANGYLWTEQYPECKSVIEEGRPQSMELDKKTLVGNWSKFENSEVEFFIIDDALFSMLCILGDDVEPCFEGSCITAPDISSDFALAADSDFTHSLYNMMQELTFALKGGLETMHDELTQNSEEIKDNLEQSVEDNIDNTVETENVDTDTTANVEFASCNNNKESENKEKASDNKESENKEKASDNKEEDEEDKKNYSLIVEELKSAKAEIESNYSILLEKFEALESECKELREFKCNIENIEKDKMIAKFSMLSDEDKSDVIANKANYSLDDIESKLSVICFRKGVNFSIQEEIDVEKEPVITTFNLESSVSNKNANVPSWIAAVQANQK